jgi:RNA polymerase sigma factor (sigma-70 family)
MKASIRTNPMSVQETSKLDDSLIVARIIKGEKELFEIILRRYNQKLYRVVRSYLKDPDDIQDAMQDTYLKAFNKLYQFNGDAAFSTWLIRIGINEALQRIKRQKILNINSGTDLTDTKIIQLPASKEMNPEYSAINREAKKLLEVAIDELPEKYRTVYVMREVEGMNNAEVAAILGVEENNVKVRHHRAKNLMKESLLKLSADAQIFEFGNAKCDAMVNFVMSRI